MPPKETEACVSRRSMNALYAGKKQIGVCHILLHPSELSTFQILNSVLFVEIPALENSRDFFGSDYSAESNCSDSFLGGPRKSKPKKN